MTKIKIKRVYLNIKNKIKEKKKNIKPVGPGLRPWPGIKQGLWYQHDMICNTGKETDLQKRAHGHIPWKYDRSISNFRETFI